MKNEPMDVIEVEYLKTICVNVMLENLIFVIMPPITIEME